MQAYLRWSFRQFFILYFQPTQFGRELKGGADKPDLNWQQRLRYMVKILPAITVLTITTNLLLGALVVRYGFHFHWLDSWVGVAVGVAVGVTRGMTRGVTRGMEFVVAFGVMLGVARGVVGGVMGGARLLGKLLSPGYLSA